MQLPFYSPHAGDQTAMTEKSVKGTDSERGGALKGMGHQRERENPGKKTMRLPGNNAEN